MPVEFRIKMPIRCVIPADASLLVEAEGRKYFISRETEVRGKPNHDIRCMGEALKELISKNPSIVEAQGLVGKPYLCGLCKRHCKISDEIPQS